MIKRVVKLYLFIENKELSFNIGLCGTSKFCYNMTSVFNLFKFVIKFVIALQPVKPKMEYQSKTRDFIA